MREYLEAESIGPDGPWIVAKHRHGRDAAALLAKVGRCGILAFASRCPRGLPPTQRALLIVTGGRKKWLGDPMLLRLRDLDDETLAVFALLACELIVNEAGAPLAATSFGLSDK